MDASSGNPTGHPEQAAPQNNNSSAMDIETPSFSGIPGLGSAAPQAAAPVAVENRKQIYRG